MMEAIGIKIKGATPVVVYGTKEGKFKYRTTDPVEKTSRDGTTTAAIHHSLSFPSIEEAVGSACRFIKKTWGIDVEALPDTDFEFEKVNVAERVVEKIAPKAGNKLYSFLSNLGKEDAEEDEEVVAGDGLVQDSRDIEASEEEQSPEADDTLL